MADQILGLLFENLNSLIQGEFGLLWGVQTEMEKLSSTLSTIQAVLEDAEVKQVQNKAINNWLRKLKDAAYDADDILDQWMTESLLKESSITRKSCINQVHNSFTTTCFDLKGLVFRHNIAKRTKEIMQKFDAIAREKSNFNLIEGQVERVGQSVQHIRITSSSPDEPKMYGRDLDKENIVTFLLDNMNCQYDIFICPIVGIGGIGKTTLAQFVFNDERVVKHFDERIWVCVSEDFGVQRLTKLIIESFSGESCNLSNLDVMQSRLKEMLEGKKFLLVLDDVWNEKQDEWNKFRHSVTFGAKGSSIIVTTRLQTVASITGIPAYHINFLSQDDCWNLFKFYAFGMGNEEKPNLAEIGYKIVQKCGGVPLAAKALGSLLRFKSEESQWKLVRDSEIWELERGEENMILPALRLSYSHLSTNLRQCFTFCSIFPKDEEMSKRDLIHLWMANGFIQSDGRMELEDIGDGIFNELVWRSIFQDVKRDEDGNVITCKIHDLMHDLASSIMANECIIINGNFEVKKNNIPKKSRHLRFFHTELVCLGLHHLQFISSQVSLRTLFYHSWESLPVMFIFSHLKCLRVLNLSCNDIHTLPPSIGNLKSLRYLYLYSCNLKSLPDSTGYLRNLQMLNLDGNKLQVLPSSIGKLEQLRFLGLSWNEDLKSLPESICCLKHLRTLDLQCCSRLQVLPKNMKNLNNLKQLHIKGCDKLCEMPMHIGQLTCLQGLDWFIVGPKDGHGAGILELHGLNLLGGELTVKHLERVSNITKDAGQAPNLMINKAPNISKLTLSWSNECDEIGNINSSYEVLEALQPHSSIQDLRVDGYSGVKFPGWLNMENPHLLFPRLKSIELYQLPYLQEWSLNWEVNQSLSALKYLSLSKCHNLKTLPAALVNLASLQELIILDCKSLTTLPKLNNSLVELNISGCDELSSMSEGLKYLTSLKILEIGVNEKLEFPADCFDNLVAPLQQLEIWNCPKLTSLPDGLQNAATTLEELSVFGCENLVVLPDWLQHFSALKELWIQDCHPDLISRCDKDNGQDWHKISHIPNIMK